MNESLDKEFKNLSIKCTYDFLEYLKIQKKELFSPRLKYIDIDIPESNISTIPLLKRWITGLSKKNNELRKSYYDDFMFYYNYVENILNKKIDKIKQGKENTLLNDLNNKCDMYRSIIKLLGSNDNYIDRLDFSKILYDIRYGFDVKTLNKNLSYLLTQLAKIGVVVTIRDFDYIIYVYNYMNEYFQLIENDEELLNSILEEYLDNHDNFKDCLYLTLLNIINKNKNILIKYLDKTVTNKLDNIQCNKENIYTIYFKTRKEYINLLGNDDLTLIEYFTKHKSKMKLYEENNDRIVKLISSISNYDIYKRYTLEEKNFYCNNLIEFYWDLAEYKFVNDYKYLFNYGEILLYTKFKMKDFESLIDAIEILNKRIIKTNKKLINERNNLNKVLVMESSKFYKVQENCNRISKNLDDLIANMLDLLSSYDNLKLIKNIHDNISDKSTIYDVLKVLNNNYNVLRLLASDNVDDICEMEYFHHLSLLDNIYFKHISSIKYLIEQKYNLYNINLNIPDVDSKEFEELRNNLVIVIRYLTLLNKDLSIEDLKIVLGEE